MPIQSTDMLRLALLASIGGACHTKVEDKTPHDSAVDSSDGHHHSGHDSGTTDSTSTDSDTAHSGTTDSGSTDSGTTDTGTTDTAADTGVITPTCNGGYPDVEESWTKNHSIGGGYWQLCLTVPFTDPSCTGSISPGVLDARFDAIITPDCIYDTGAHSGWGYPSPTNPPCDDHLTNFAGITCGPYADAAGNCCYEVNLSQIAIGRPLVVEGRARMGDAVVRDGWSSELVALSVPTSLVDAVVAGWLEIARAEHASVGSFAGVVLDLSAHGAPADLIVDAVAAQADEIRHARDAFAVASGVAGKVFGPGPIDLAGYRVRTRLEDVVRAVIIEGCVGETLAAHEARVASGCAADASLAAMLAGVADDETRHAALAWRTLAWALTRDPSLRAVARETFDQAVSAVRARAIESGPDLRAWGLVTGLSRHTAACEAADAVIGPCREALGV